MNRKTLLLIGSVFLVNALFTLSIGQAYAASCFTDTGGHWAETFICWLKSNGLSSGYLDGTFRPDNTITRAEVASLLYHQAGSGEVHVNTSMTAWQIAGNYGENPPAYDLVYTELRPGGVASTYYYMAGVTMDSAEHNQQMTIKGVQLCYAANLSSGYISHADLYLTQFPSYSFVDSLADATARTDAACRTYTFATADPLTAQEHLMIQLSVTTTGSADYVAIWSLTAIEGYTTGPAVLSPNLPLSARSQP